MTTFNKGRLAGILAATSALTPIGLAFAQAPAGGGQELVLEEIVVTARRESERLLDVPLAITAFGAEEIERRGIRNIEDVAAATPGLTFSNLQGEFLPQPVIRGFAPINILGNVENNAAIFVDGIFVAGREGLNFNQLDIERIEVVKGPQAALYGRNAFSGAINYVTAKPTDQLKAKTEIQYGSHNKVAAQMSVSGPLIPGVLRGRVALGYDSFDGSYNNQYSGFAPKSKIGDYRYETFNGSLVWTPSEKFEGELGAYISNDQPGNAPIGIVAANCENTNSLLSNQNPTVYVKYLNYCGEFQAVGRNGLSVMPQAKGEDRDLVRGHLSLKWTTDFGTISALTGYSKVTQSYYVDGTRGLGESAKFSVINVTGTQPGFGSVGTIGVFETGILQVGPDTPTEEISQELRFTSDPKKNLRYSVGVNYYDTERRSSLASGVFSTKPLPANAILCLSCRLVPGSTTLWWDPAGGAYPIFASYFDGTALNDTRETKYQVKAPSGFAYVEYDFSEAYKVRVEGRYTDEEKTFFNPATNVKSKENFGTTQWRASLDYKPADNWTIYGIYGHAEKAGGLDVKTVQFTANVNTPVGGAYGPETNDGFELGFKAELMDRRIRVDGAIYRYKWKDLAIPQVLTEVVNPATGASAPILTPTSFLRNSGDATNQGAEFNVEARFTERLDGRIGFAYIDAKYDKATAETFRNFPSFSPIGSIAGKQLLRTSKYQGAASLGYTAPFRGNTSWYLRGDLAYRDKQYADAVNEAIIPSSTTLNAQLGLRGDKWTVELWGRNITNEDGPIGAYRDICFTNALCNGQFYRTPSPNSTTPAGTAGSSTLFNGYRYTVTYPRLFEYGLTVRYRF